MLWDRTLATPTSTNTRMAKLFLILDPKSNERAIFDEDRLKENEKSILFLLGQLKVAHLEKKTIRLFGGVEKYDGSIWTNVNPDAVFASYLFKLYYMAKVIHYCSFIKADENNHYTISFVRELTPTLSPSDPNFPAWWEEHKAEWEDPKN